MALDGKRPLPEKFKAVRKAFAKATEAIHQSKGFTAKDLKKPAILELTKETYNVLADSVNTAIEHEMPEVMRESLQRDVFVFSGMKTYAQLKEASALLLTDDGDLKPFDQFAKDIAKIDSSYNENYLEAEYLFAGQSAQMADKWQEMAKDGDRYNLQYRTAGDSKVREAHRVLQDITLPFDDPFWDKYYPPNGWRCRCTVAQVRKGKYEESDSDEAVKHGEKATTQLDKDGKNTAEIFRFNPGKQKVIFPPTHPYSKIARNAKSTIDSITKKERGK